VAPRILRSEASSRLRRSGRYQTTGITERAMTQMGQKTTGRACRPAGVETSPG